ncbi:MAG TPA: histidine phosphatase family protein [Candidatus Lustribacter sp.]|jgi:broad specificity phosphatase PhoE|nr:histidine phosphatase family protein [Candidatus Lustribacter sp.]
MELICVRHGRTAWNAGRRFQGQTDIPLDDEGLAQAQALAVHLRSERFDRALASDLVRARTTAETICAPHGLAIELTAELREMHFGQWEGLRWDEIVARWPELDAKNEKAPMYYTAEGGESWDALCARVDTFLRATTARMAPGDRALIVSHAGVMHGIVRSLTSAGGNGAHPPAVGIKFVPAGILRARGSFETGWELTAINETADTGTAA